MACVPVLTRHAPLKPKELEVGMLRFVLTVLNRGYSTPYYNPY